MRNFVGTLLNKKPRASAEKVEILLKDPIPLYSQDIKLALFWSAKSGCTFAVRWFFYQAGMLDEVTAYGPWVHDYREEVYSVDPELKSNIGHIFEEETRVVKVVRNPYSRAVSSYLMAVRSGYENYLIGNYLGRVVDAKNGFSFSEFLDYLGSIDLRNCNIHHRLQLHPAEEQGLMKPDFIIHLEDSFNEIRNCENALGLPNANLIDFRTSGHNTLRRKWPDYWGEVKLFRRLGNKILPEAENFYNSHLRRKVESLYAEDFKHYRYSPLLNRDNDSIKLAYRDNSILLDELKTQIPISGPLEKVEDSCGLWDDGWCSSNVSVTLKTYEDISKVKLTGCLPGFLVTDNLLDVNVNGNSLRVRIDNTQDFKIEAPVECLAGEEINIRITSSVAKSGVEEGVSKDRRKISFFLKEIQL